MHKKLPSDKKQIQSNLNYLKFGCKDMTILRYDFQQMKMISWDLSQCKVEEPWHQKNMINSLYLYTVKFFQHNLKVQYLSLRNYY